MPRSQEGSAWSSLVRSSQLPPGSPVSGWRPDHSSPVEPKGGHGGRAPSGHGRPRTAACRCSASSPPCSSRRPVRGGLLTSIHAHVPSPTRAECDLKASDRTAPHDDATSTIPPDATPSRGVTANRSPRRTAVPYGSLHQLAGERTEGARYAGVVEGGATPPGHRSGRFTGP